MSQAQNLTMVPSNEHIPDIRFLPTAEAQPRSHLRAQLLRPGFSFRRHLRQIELGVDGLGQLQRPARVTRSDFVRMSLAAGCQRWRASRCFPIAVMYSTASPTVRSVPPSLVGRRAAFRGGTNVLRRLFESAQRARTLCFFRRERQRMIGVAEPR
jgi:hypothetical protein